MLQSIVKGLVGAALSALTDYLKAQQARRDQKQIGRLEENADATHETLNRVQRANALRAKLRSDPALRQRVRDAISSL